MLPDFPAVFRAATGHEPRAYQERLAARLAAGDVPPILDVPTGMGKTLAVLLAWLYALAADADRGGAGGISGAVEGGNAEGGAGAAAVGAGEGVAGTARRVARRLHLVVDRRVVVDDAHRCVRDLERRLARADAGPLAQLAEVLRERLDLAPDEPVLEVRRLRGGLPRDLTEHTRNPARPAIVLGTLDMTCSRLLFRGYQLSPRRRSIDAALTGLDSWWVLDEAHLSTQTRTTLETLQTRESALEDRFGGAVPGLRVMAMSATPDRAREGALTWDAAREEARDPALARRRRARDAVPVAVVEATKSGVDAVVATAAGIVPALDRGEGLVVFCTTVADAKAVQTSLGKPCKKHGVALELLTGGMPERFTRGVVDRLGAYRTGCEDREKADPVVVVATSTLEVGADLDFTHLVTKACGADSLIQRLGRINRVGAREDGSVTIIHTDKSDPIHGDAADAVVRLIADATTLGEVVARLRSAKDPAALRRPRQVPVVIPPTVLRAYVRTAGSRNDPPVAPWIRDLQDLRAEVVLVARDRVDLLAEDPLLADLAQSPPDLRAEGWTLRMADVRGVARTALETAPVIVLDPARQAPPRVLRDLGDLGGVGPNAVLVVDSRAAARALGIADAGRDLSDRLLLPGADAQSLRKAVEDEASRGEKNDVGAGAPRVILTDLGGETGDEGEARADVLLELADEIPAPQGWVLEAEVLGEASPTPWLRLGLARPADEERRRAVPLGEHNRAVGERAGQWARSIGLPERVVDDIALAGAHHDAGKNELAAFQTALRMREGGDGWLEFGEAGASEPLAKSALQPHLWRRSAALAGVPRGWRHEAASARVLDESVAGGGGGPARPHDHELVRHLILSHHGFYRGPGPVCPQGGVGDRTGGAGEPYLDPASPRWAGQIESFHRLNERYGPYGLALAEAVLRLADWDVSRKEQECHG